MPGTTTWTGGSQDGNWATAGNWTTSGGSTPPGAGDDVVISGGDRDISLGLTTGVQYANFTVTEGFRHNIGTVAAPLLISGVTGKVNITVVGQFIKIATVTNAIVAMSVTFKSRGVFSFSSGTATFISLTGSGTVDIDGAAIVTGIKIDGPTVTAGANGTAFTSATMGAGQLTTSRNITLFVGSQSKLITLGSAAIASGYLGAGCSHNHQSSGTITLLELFPGSFHYPDGNTNVTYTITTLYRHVGANFTREYNSKLVTVTNEFPI